jgi:RNA polymerase sigma-70 factor (ECF subfamily)
MYSGLAMSTEGTTVAVQRYLDDLAGDRPAEPIVRALLDRSARRLQLLCGNLLYREYRRLTLPPLNLQPDELLGAVVERLLKAMRSAGPQTVRQFFALANLHLRWELNDLARRLDEQPAAVELNEGLIPSPPSSSSVLTPEGRRMLEAIDRLPEEEREAFGLVRVQGLTHGEAAEVLGVSPKTVPPRTPGSRAIPFASPWPTPPTRPGATAISPSPAAARSRSSWPGNSNGNETIGW